jgi:hypothetical protein
MILDGRKVVEFPAVLEVRLLGHSKMKAMRGVAGHLKLLGRLLALRLHSGAGSLDRSSDSRRTR